MPQQIEVPGMGIVEFPDGMSDDAIASAIKANSPAAAQPVSRMEKFAMGAGDVIHGGAQLLTQALPKGVVDAGNRANNWLADKTGLVAKVPEGGVDQMVREREQAYQSRRAASEPQDLSSLVTGQRKGLGFDGWRLAGAVVPSLMMPAASAATLPGRIGLGAAAGAVGGAATPVTEGDFWKQKQKQVATGAAFGAAAPVVGQAVSRVISPKASTNTAVKSLMKEGVTPTPGQVVGGAGKRLEEGLTSLPIVGSFIRGGQTRALEDLNRAAANRSLAPIGGKLPKGVVGRDAVEFVERELGKSYDDLLPNLTVKADRQFADEVGGLSKMVREGSIDPKYAKAFDRFMSDNVFSKFRGQKALTGQTLKDIESDLGQKAARLGQSQDPDARLMADALREAQGNLRGLLERSNPQASSQLKAVNTGYANFKRLQRASGSVAAEDGVFSAAQLHNAVKTLDRSKDKAAFARGNALMQDLSENAKKVLGPKLPDSGTPERMLSLGMFLDPRTYATALAAPLLYSSAGQGLLATTLAKRPEGAKAVADALQKASPGLGLLGGQAGLQLGF